jgi:uncharacterized protein YecE (DUF72 family)
MARSGTLIRVGPAGWSYPDSPGKIYPATVSRRFDVLAFTARYFDCIEINATFYHPPPPRTCASWVRRVADHPDFRFTAKLWQRFTHESGGRGTGDRGPGTIWSEQDVRLVREGLQVLRDEGRLGAVLAQFPWSFRPSAEAAQVLTRLADDFAGWPLVVELRHGSWAAREHALLLRRLGLGFCNIDQPVVGESLGPTAGVTSPVGYVRFHGRRYDQWFEAHEDAAARYDYLYSAEELTPWVERIRKVADAAGVTDVYVVSNNHFEGKGPANALMIRSLLEGRKVPCPPILFESYRRVLEPFAEPA